MQRRHHEFTTLGSPLVGAVHCTPLLSPSPLRLAEAEPFGTACDTFSFLHSNEGKKKEVSASLRERGQGN